MASDISAAIVVSVLFSAVASGQQLCQTRPQFAFQLAQPVRLVAYDTGSSPKMTTDTRGAANLVRFIVDTTGSPVPFSAKALEIRDTTLFQSFIQALPNWHFEPARARNGCKANQVVIASISWRKT